MREKNYLDALAEFGIGGAHPGGLTLTESILANEQITTNTVVLDAGCGTGQTSAYLYQQFGAQVVAMDNNDLMLEKAQVRFTSDEIPITPTKGSIENIPFSPLTFDYCLSESVLLFVNIEISLAEIYRVLKSGSHLLAIEATLNMPLIQSEVATIQSFYGFSDLLFEEDWRAAFEKAGFANIQISNTQSLNVDIPTTEFFLSKNIDPALYSILDQHEQLVTQYKDLLGFRVYRGTKL